MQNVLKLRTSTRKRTRIIEENDRVIHSVTLTNMRRTQGAVDGRMDFTLIVKANDGGFPTVYVMLYFNEGPTISDDVSEEVEMDDCLPFEIVPRSTVSSDLFLKLLEENGHETVPDMILANLVAPLAKLRITAKRAGIHFVLTIGTFETEAMVDPDRLKKFIVPKPVRAV